MIDIKKEFGIRLKEKRESLGFTQEKVAEMIGKDISYISKIENGKANTNLNFIGKLYSVYGIDSNQEFFCGHNEDDLIVKIKMLTKEDYLLICGIVDLMLDLKFKKDN